MNEQSRVGIRCLSLLLFAFAPSITSAGIIYDPGVPQRPLQVTELNLANGTFTATFHYSVAFGDSLVDQSAITGSSDADVTVALLAQLNTSNVDSSPTLAWISVYDTAPLGDALQFTGSAIIDSDGTLNNWSESTGLSEFDSNTASTDFYALVTFSSSTSVPEPSSLALASVAIAGLALRCRKRRKTA